MLLKYYCNCEDIKERRNNYGQQLQLPSSGPPRAAPVCLMSYLSTGPCWLVTTLGSAVLKCSGGLRCIYWERCVKLSSSHKFKKKDWKICRVEFLDPASWDTSAVVTENEPQSSETSVWCFSSGAHKWHAQWGFPNRVLLSPYMQHCG